ncbi:MAG: hypothetical protein WD448_10270 [Woeseia sp.]
MFKTFIFGIVSGGVIAAALLWFVPVVDQHREASIISVVANGGNTETFHVNLPEDRVFAGSAGRTGIPESVEWPEEALLEHAQAELFKIRNRNDVVIGVASRVRGPVSDSGTVTEWTLHLPARGTLYVSMHAVAAGTSNRKGALRAGTREFAGLTGTMNERFVEAGAGDPAQPGVEGRIELLTSLVGTRHGSGENGS